MRAKMLPVVFVLAVCGSVWVAGIASAGTAAETTVTIQTANGDFWGTVDSPRPRVCARDRNIVVFKQSGTEQDPRVDQKVASDTASLNGDRYEWNTGNTGLFGKFYARARRTTDCKADTSRTVRSVRS